MIDTQEVKDSRVQVVDGNGRVGGRVADLVGRAVADTPPFTPPPASQTVNPRGLWSRPGFWPVWATGSRPNSPPQITRVSSSSPRWARSSSKPGDRLVGLAGELFVIALDVDVAVPRAFVFHAPGVNLDEPHSALDQPAGRQALACEVVAARVADAVKLAGRNGALRPY